MSTRSERLSIAMADGEEMGVYVSRPSGNERHAGIIVFQEALGVNEQIRRLTDRYAALGFVAIAPDLFHRVSPGYEAQALVMDNIMPLVKQMTVEGFVADSKAAYSWITSAGGVEADKVAAVGFCMGGRAAFVANSELPLAAAISYYGGGLAPAVLDRVPSMHGPHLFFWGGQDKGIPPEQHRAVTDAYRAAGKKFVDVEFSECNHAFFNEDADRYNEPAAKQSWALGNAFLADALGIVL